MDRFEEQRMVMEDLWAAGLPREFRSIADVDSGLKDMRPYLSILDGWRRKAQFYETKAGLMSALTPQAKYLVPELIDELRRPELHRDLETDRSEVWRYVMTISTALGAMARREYLPALVEILSDRGSPTYLYALGPVTKFSEPSLVPLFAELLDDPHLGPGNVLTATVLEGLGKTRSPEALAIVRRYAEHPDPLIRRYANTAIRRLERDVARYGTQQAAQ